MPRYMLLLHGAANPPIEELGPSGLEAVIRRYKDWADETKKAGRLVGGQKLMDGTGRLLSKSAAKKVVVTDGPFVETKDVIGGFFAIEARDYDEAVAIARDCPHLDWFGGKIEIREIDAANSMPDAAAPTGSPETRS